MIDLSTPFEEIQRRLRDAEAKRFKFRDADELAERTEICGRAIRAGKPRFVEAAELAATSFQGDFHVYTASLRTDSPLGPAEFAEALKNGFRYEFPFVTGICSRCGVQVRLPASLVHVEGSGDKEYLVTNHDTASPGQPCTCPMHGPGEAYRLQPVGCIERRPATAEAAHRESGRKRVSKRRSDG